MNATISRCSKSRIHRPPTTGRRRTEKPPRCDMFARFRPGGRQPELGGRKKDEDGTQRWMSNYDHRVALTVDFSRFVLSSSSFCRRTRRVSKVGGVQYNGLD